MADTGYSNRWWENYLVRYLIPSIAGMVIVSWLMSVSGDDGIKKILLFDFSETKLETSTITLLFLYGNLFCYIASLPILVFHATRVIDFTEQTGTEKLKQGPLDAYIVTIIIFFFLVIVGSLLKSIILKNPYSPLLLALLFSAYQLYRIYCALKERDSKNTLAYGYILKLAKQRVGYDSDLVKFDNINNQNLNKEIVETYRHLREHGNATFIFFLELILALLCYLIVSNTTLQKDDHLPAIGILFGIWAIPGVFTHYFAQNIEYTFSGYSKSSE